MFVEPLAPFRTILSWCLRSYLRTVGRTLRPTFLSVVDSGDYNDDLEFAHRLIDIRNQQGPAIYVFWIADHINLLSLAYASPKLRTLARRFKFFADDSFGGRIVRDAIHAIEADFLPISQSDPVERLRLLKSIMLERPSAFLAVDGRGPYFRVGTGIINLAYATKASLIPCAILAKPSVPIGNSAVSVSIPLPRSKVVAAIGHPLSFNHAHVREPATSGAIRLQASLDGLRTEVARCLRHRQIPR